MKLRSLQYMRGVAALMVVAYHTHWSYTFVGQSGADVFFVVSGFVMVLVGDRATSPGGFLLARALRIVPLYWVLTLLWYLREVWLHGFADPGLLLSSLTFIPASRFPLIFQGWTLNYEALFYAVFAAAMLAPRRLRLEAVTAGIVGLLALGALLRPSTVPLTVWTNPIMLEFLCGAWLCRAWQQGLLPRDGRVAWPMIGLALAALAATQAMGEQEAAAVRFLVWGVPGTALVAGTLILEGCGRLPQVGLLGRIGDSSYALYLVHVAALLPVSAALSRLPTPIALVAAVAWCVGVGWVTHRLIELPAGQAAQALRDRLGGRKAASASSAGALGGETRSR